MIFLGRFLFRGFIEKLLFGRWSCVGLGMGRNGRVRVLREEGYGEYWEEIGKVVGRVCGGGA